MGVEHTKLHTMASDFGFVEYVCDQLAPVGAVSVRKMFGEYCVYVEGKVVGLVVNNQLMLKPSDAGRAFYGDGPTAQPFPGAKDWLAVGERLDDRLWIQALVRTSLAALPEPQLRKPRTRKSPRNSVKD